MKEKLLELKRLWDSYVLEALRSVPNYDRMFELQKEINKKIAELS